MKMATQDFQRSIARKLMSMKYVPDFYIEHPYLKTLAPRYTLQALKDERLEYNCEVLVPYRYFYVHLDFMGATECCLHFGWLDRWQRLEWFLTDQVKDSIRVIESHIPRSTIKLTLQNGQSFDITETFDYRNLGNRQTHLIWDIEYEHRITSTTVEADPWQSMAAMNEQLRILTNHVNDFHQEFRQLLTE